uniref:Large ribosomal subunit protein bL19c n=1 Tax=Polysiphonia sertularioides TaxID=945028 RepID=A0A1Z1MGC0_9FLOR|nr:ribosomal protein L19 [Polysiphonia sertularioides]
MIRKKTEDVDLVQLIEQDYLKENSPSVQVGDTVKIKKVIQEGTKERIQTVEGVVIARRNSSINKTITIRKTIYNIGVERVYLINSPQIMKIEVLRQAKIRRSKLYYLRNRSGKATRLKQKVS